MKNRRITSAILFLFGFLLAALTLCITVIALYSQPAILKSPEAAQKRAIILMEALCSGNDSAASAVLYGKPSLGNAPDGEKAADQIYNAYRQSMSYRFDGSCYITETGAAVDAVVTSLDIPTVLTGLAERVQELLNLKMASSNRDASFGADGQLLPEASEKLLSDAILLTLSNKVYREQRITLNLTYENGKWWIQPDEPLMDLLSGGFDR